MKIKRYQEFRSVNEAFTFADLKNTLSELGSKIGRGLSQGVALAMFLALVGKAELTQAQTQEVIQKADDYGFLTGLGGVGYDTTVRQKASRIEEGGYKKGEFREVTVYHKVKPNETVYSICKFYLIKPEILSDINDLIDYKIRVGQELKIPMVLIDSNYVPKVQPEFDEDRDQAHYDEPWYQDFSAEIMAEPTKDTVGMVDYQIGPGDNIYRIGRTIGMTPDQILAFNPGKTTDLRELDFLKIPADKIHLLKHREYPENAETSEYVVQYGDTFANLARKFNTTITNLLQLNGRYGANPNDKLDAKQVIKVPKMF